MLINSLSFSNNLDIKLTETHIIIRFFLLLFLGLFSGGGITTGSSSTTSSNGGTGTRSTNVQEESLKVLTSEGLGIEREPDRLNLNTSSRDKSLELVSLYIKKSRQLAEPIQFIISRNLR
jgi:hypothetical protein